MAKKGKKSNITVAEVTDILNADVARLVISCIKEIANTLGLSECHFVPLESNDGFKTVSYRSSQVFAGLDSKVKDRAYLRLHKIKNKKAGKKQPKAPAAARLQINLHDYPGFKSKVEGMFNTSEGATESAIYINLTNRVSMWFAAPSLEATDDFLSRDPFPELAGISIAKFLDDNPTSIMHFVYDPLLLAAGKGDKVLAEIKVKYRERFDLIDVNDPTCFLSERSSLQEKIVYWLARYLLSLARDPDLEKRKSVNVVTVKDLLQQLPKLFITGNIMDCIDNVLIFPERFDKPQEWETSHTPRSFLICLGKASSSDWGVTCDEDDLIVNNDVMIPVFTHPARDEKYITEDCYDFMSKLTQATLVYMLPQIEREFAAYLQSLMPEDEVTHLVDAVNKITRGKVDENNISTMCRTFFSNLFLFYTEDSPEYLNDMLGDLMRLLFPKEPASYTEICRLSHHMDFDRWHTTIQQLCVTYPLHKVRIKQLLEHIDMKELDRDTYDVCMKSACEMLITYSAGPHQWKEAMFSRTKGSAKQLTSRSFLNLTLRNGPKESQFLKGDAIIWTGLIRVRPVIRLVLLLADPVAYQLVINGSSEWRRRFEFKGRLRERQLKKDGSVLSTATHPIDDFAIDQVLTLCIELGMLGFDESELLSLLLKASQTNDVLIIRSVVDCALSIITEFQTKYPKDILIKTLDQLRESLGKTIHYHTRPCHGMLAAQRARAVPSARAGMFDAASQPGSPMLMDQVKNAIQHLNTMSVAAPQSRMPKNMSEMRAAIQRGAAISAKAGTSVDLSQLEQFLTSVWEGKGNQIANTDDRGALQKIIADCEAEIDVCQRCLNDEHAYREYVSQEIGPEVYAFKVKFLGSWQTAAQSDFKQKLERAQADSKLAKQRLDVLMQQDKPQFAFKR